MNTASVRNGAGARVAVVAVFSDVKGASVS
jgi:hypothetical protein